METYSIEAVIHSRTGHYDRTLKCDALVLIKVII